MASASWRGSWRTACARRRPHLVVNGYEIINPGFQRRALVTYMVKEMGFDTYHFVCGGEPAVQLVRRLS